MTTRISGFASRFNKLDLGSDVVVPGAFTQSLRHRSSGPVRMLYQHDLTRPIGRWLSLHETPEGLWAEGELATDMRLANDVVALLKNSAIDGLSIGFRATRATKGKGRIRRMLLALDLVEISIVTFPMQPLARVSYVVTTSAPS